jgi:hypothetical protein
MRDNTIALRALPYYREEPGTKGKAWGVFTAPSVSAFLQYVREYGQTPNENGWSDSSDWIGLGEQSRQDFMETGIAKKPLNDVKSAAAKLPHRHTALSKPLPAITGAIWDVPAVLANVPLAARSRLRQRLAPINIRLACFWSGGISSEALAPVTAKLTKAINDYTMAGGIVTLTVGFISSYTDSEKRLKQCFAGCKVNAADLSNIATIISPVGFRALGGRMLSALCETRGNPTRGFDTDEGLQNTLFLNGRLEDVFKSADVLIQRLELT